MLRSRECVFSIYGVFDHIVEWAGRMSGVCWEVVWSGLGGCVLGGCVEWAERLCGVCLEDVWSVLGGCVEWAGWEVV